MSAKTRTSGTSNSSGTKKTSSPKKPAGPKKRTSQAKKPGGTKKAAGQGKAAGKKPGGRKGGGGGFKRWLPLLVLFVLVLSIGGMLSRDYQARVVLDRVEGLVGPLEAEGVRLRVADAEAAWVLLDELETHANRSLGLLQLDGVHEDYGALNTRVVYRGQGVALLLYWEDEVVAGQWAQPSGDKPQLALIIDDLGRSVRELERLLALPYVVTPAILPREPRSARVTALTAEAGREFMLHMPMEPRAYPETDPGPGALLVELDEAEVRQRLADALALVEGAAGVNNHMGSRATEIAHTMGGVMDELAARDLYFIDSLTTPNSVAIEMANSAGVYWASRDVFLDNVQEVDEIRARISEALEKAQKRGRAIAIGHPYPETLEALELMAETIEQSGVELVAPSRLLHPPDS